MNKIVALFDNHRQTHSISVPERWLNTSVEYHGKACLEKSYF